jgi:hypothetical protein
MRESSVQKARRLIWERDSYRCVYCKAEVSRGNRSVDHVMAAANGGSHDPDNLVTACMPCNRSGTPADSVSSEKCGIKDTRSATNQKDNAGRFDTRQNGVVLVEASGGGDSPRFARPFAGD